MNQVVLSLVAVVASFFLGMIICPIFLKITKKHNTEQVILSYVEQHQDKKHTPTMGGVTFIIATTIVALAFGGYRSSLSVMLILIMVAYGLIGFLDDFIKVKFKRNLGLKAYQKIISQLAVGVIAAVYAAKSPFVGTTIALPIVGATANLGAWYIPFAVFMFISMTNAVNLTDGLDGLAASTNAIYLSCFWVIIALGLADAIAAGDALYSLELKQMATTVGALIGSLLAFLWYNAHQARLFMGDTGSLALGGVAAAVALFIKNPLISVLVGIMFVVSVVSVIMQVASFKLTKKRIFLMAPFHHHLELQGYNESKIVAFYAIITVITAIVSLIIK